MLVFFYFHKFLQLFFLLFLHFFDYNLVKLGGLVFFPGGTVGDGTVDQGAGHLSPFLQQLFVLALVFLYVILIKLVVFPDSIQDMLVLHLLYFILFSFLFFILNVQVLLVLHFLLLYFPLLYNGLTYPLTFNNLFQVILDLLPSGLSSYTHQFLLFLKLEFVLLLALALDLFLSPLQLLCEFLVLLEGFLHLFFID